MDIYQEQIASDIEAQLTSAGMTLSQLVQFYGSKNSALLNLSAEQYAQFSRYYNLLIAQDYSTFSKGKLLENITSVLFQNSLFYIRRNCRTCTNELDLLVEWSEISRLSLINQGFPCFGDSFICECKNYSSAVDVTYVGKFFSLLHLANTYLGIMIAWDGITGRNNWKDAKGLIRKIALGAHTFIVIIDKHDLQDIYEQKTTIFSLVNEKYQALKNDIDYSQYVKNHPAEKQLLNHLSDE